MKALFKIIANTASVYISAYLLTGVFVEDVTTALIVAIVLGVLNTIAKPIVVVLTLPITILTLGLFTFVISFLFILLTDALIPGFYIDGMWTAVLFGIVLSILNSFFTSLLK